MRVTVTFLSTDDTSHQMRRRIEGVCLTLDELKTASWAGKRLTYQTTRSARNVIASWEQEGFEIDEFESFAFS